MLSLFDGMSCGQIALERAGIKVNQYFASEIDKYAIQVTQHNYPKTIQLGSVVDVCDMVLPDIDLLIGGSPCQGFSFAGKQLNFDDPRSKLFFEYVRILNQLRVRNPNMLFLMENVLMKQESQDVISGFLGVDPIKFNSAIVSGQNRKRLYWTNIQGIETPSDRNIFLKDVLETPGVGVIKNRNKLYVRNEKAMCLDASYYKGVDNHGQRTQILENKNHSCILAGIASDINGHDIIKRVYSPEGKSPTLTAVCGGNQEIKVAMDELHYRKLTPVECERLQTVSDNYTSLVSNSQRYRMLGNGWTVEMIAHMFSYTPYSNL